MVSSAAVGDLYKVLIAVDIKREDEKYQAIMDAVVAYGKTVAASHENGEVHAVSAYSGSEDFRHVTDIAKRVGIDTSRIHEVQGKPDKAIVEVAREIGAHIIIVGLSTKSTLSNRIFGSMIDRLLNNVDHDIMVVIPEIE
ncbi:MAG: nucleotide-binding universal stress UspA family protein [Gammaproteobacteria bacterium]